MALMEIRNEKEESIRSALSTEVVRLSFRKVKTDETRVMRATLADEYIPKSQNVKSTRKEPEGLVTIWDLDVNGWRRFYTDRVDEWEVEKIVDEVV